MIHKVQFKNGRGLTLRGYVSVPKKYGAAILFLHGFPGSCEGSTAARLLQIAGKTNYLLMVFSFSHSPPSDGKFENKLMSKEVEDIRYAIDFLEQNYQYTQLILAGISTGAIDASLYAHKDKRIHKLVLLGAESDTKHSVRYDFTDTQVHDFWTKGYVVYRRPGHWVHGKKLKKAFYDEFFTLNIPAAIKKYKKPLLIIHGEKDEAVPLKDAQELFQIANKPKKLIVIKDADHRFSKPLHFLKVLKVVNEFVEERFK